MFLGSPRGWAPPRIDQETADQFRHRCSTQNLPVFVHAAYLINLASPKPDTLQKSITTLKTTLTAAEQIGAQGVVVHAGSSIDGDRPAALERLATAYATVLEDTPQKTRLLVEPTAGAANATASTLKSTAEYLHAIDRPEVGLCLDTCHLHAAGETLDDADALHKALTELTDTIGPDRIDLIHLNDSKDPHRSGRDRHETLGHGTIGEHALRNIITNPALATVPMVVETPVPHAPDVAYAKRLRSPT